MDGRIIPIKRTEWNEKILRDDKEFERGFRELGLDPEIVQGDLKAYWEATSPLRVPPRTRGRVAFGSHEGREAWIQRRWKEKAESAKNGLKKLLRKREYRIEDSVIAQVKVPLFRLHSPKVKGSKVIYEEAQSKETEVTWAVTILGTGMGATQSFGVRYAASFESTNGICKLIFAPVSIQVSLIGVYQRGKCLAKGLRTEMIGEKNETKINRGIAQLPEGACLQSIGNGEDVRTIENRRDAPHIWGRFFRKLRKLLPVVATATAIPGAPDVEVFPLLEDFTDSIATYERSWMSDDNYEVNLGVEGFNMKASSRADITLKRAISLKFELPAGHNYRLRFLKDMHGLAWIVE